MKEVFNILFYLFLFIITLPILVSIYLYIKFKENTNPIFTQLRVGQNGKLFRLYKFKTMVDDNENILKEYLNNNKEAKKEWEKYKKLKNDPRITKIGKFLRKTSLDELPQIINILKRDMNLIGPRPYLLEEIENTEFYNLYITIKPGLSGLWQVSGRNEVSFQNRIKLDTFYIKNHSLYMDIYIFLKTIKIVLQKTGY